MPTAMTILAGLSIERELESSARRSALRVRDGSRDLFVKVRRHVSLTQMLRATLGRSESSNEARMCSVAAAAGFAVAPHVQHRRRRRIGLVVEEALLLQWYDGRTCLQDWTIAAAKRGDHAAVERAQRLLADWTVRVRKAGLADRDLGAHNLLVNAEGGDPIWIDLEAARRSAPTEPAGTADTLGAVLSNWFICVLGRQQALTALWHTLRRDVPEPHTGWPSVMINLNEVIHHRVAKAMRGGWIDRTPAELSL